MFGYVETVAPGNISTVSKLDIINCKIMFFINEIKNDVINEIHKCEIFIW